MATFIIWILSVICVASKYSYSASLNVSTHLSYDLYVGNPIVTSEEAETGAAAGAPCSDSNSTLKEHMKKLDDMELLDDNEATSDETSDDK